MKVTWGFDIGGTKFYSTKGFVYGAVTYLAKIIPDSFDGIHQRVDIVSKLYAPNETSFDISNTDGLLSETDFQGVNCYVGQLLDGVLNRQWNFVIETAVEGNGKIHCVCVDRISQKLKGDFPTTPSLSANFPSDNVPEDKEDRVPITLGTAFIPCAPFISGGLAYCGLGKTGSTYTITKVRSPRQWDLQSEWDNSYTYTQSTKSGSEIDVRGVQLMIAPNPAGAGYVSGIWKKNGTTLSPLIQFSGPLSTTHTPGRWVKEILQMFGVNLGYLDTATFDACRTGVSWGGGFWKAEAKESLLSSLLSMCDCYLSLGATVAMYEFSKAPVETIDASKVLQLSFSPSKTTKSESDGGTVRFVWDGEPQDELNGEADVGLYAAQATVNDPSNDVFEYRFGYDNAEAQAFGSLFFQKKFDQKYSVSFSTTMDKLTTRATLRPGQVITLYHITSDGLKLYGASKNVVITSIHFKPGLEVTIEGTVYNHLEQYSDFSPAEIIPDESTNTDFEFNSLTRLVTITGQNTFHFMGGETVPDQTSITLTATLFGGLTTYDWEYWTGSAWANLSGTQNASTYDLAYDDAAWNGYTLRVRCLSGTYYSETTITKIYDGIDGTPGAPGTDGLDGPGVAYRGTWVTGQSYVGTVYIKDVVLYSGLYYVCQTSHTSGTWATDLAAGKWISFSNVFKQVATDILLAQDVIITKGLTFGGDGSTGSGGFIKVTGSKGLYLDSTGGIRLSPGADITLESNALGAQGTIQFLTSNGQGFLGPAYSTDIITFRPSIDQQMRLEFGVYGSAAVWDQVVTNAYEIACWAKSSAQFGMATTSDYVYVTPGLIDLHATSQVRLYSPVIAPAPSTVVDIGTISSRIRDLHIYRAIGASATPFTGSIYGDWTSPTRSAFLATKSVSQAVSGATNTLITFNAEPFDVGADFSASTFVAPVTGKYSLSATIIISAFNMVTPDTYIRIWIQTSNRNYYTYVDPRVFDFSGTTHTLIVTMPPADMDAGDSAAVYTSSSTNGYTIYGSAQGCFFAGTLIN